MAELTDVDLIKAIELTEALLAKRAEADAALKSAFIELSSAKFSRSGFDTSSLLQPEFYPTCLEEAPRVVDFDSSATRIAISHSDDKGADKGHAPSLPTLRRRDKSGVGRDKDEDSSNAHGKRRRDGNSYIQKWIGVKPSGAVEKARKGFVQALNVYVEVAALVRELRQHSEVAQQGA